MASADAANTSGKLMFMVDSTTGAAIDPLKGQMPEFHDVPIRNGRLEDASFFGLHTSGFDFVKWRPSEAVTQNWYDDQHVMRTYYGELEAFLLNHTGAKAVLVAGHFARDAMADALQNRVQDKLGTGGFSGGTIRLAHNDFTPNYKDLLLDYLTPGSELAVENGIQAFKDPKTLKPIDMSPKELRASRIVVVNVWRGTDRYPLQGTLLALCDKRTIQPSDLFTGQFAKPEELPKGESGEKSFGEIKAVNTYMALRFSEKQQWYYFPDMQQDENIIIKTFDSEHPDHAPCHGAFDDPRTIQSALPRRSCETRCVLVFPPTNPASKL